MQNRSYYYIVTGIKQFQVEMAVREFSLAVPSGECFGMLGPYGA